MVLSQYNQQTAVKRLVALTFDPFCTSGTGSWWSPHPREEELTVAPRLLRAPPDAFMYRWMICTDIAHIDHLCRSVGLSSLTSAGKAPEVKSALTFQLRPVTSRLQRRLIPTLEQNSTKPTFQEPLLPFENAPV